MTHALRPFLVLCLATALTACGGGAKLGGGKEGAVEALQEIGSLGNDASGAWHGGTVKAASDITFTDTRTVKCAHGGTVKVSTGLDASGGGSTGTVALVQTLELDGCNPKGRNTFDGTMTTTMNVAGTDTTATVDARYKGRVDISGEVDDFVDADVTFTMSAAQVGKTGAEVTLTSRGTITTSTATHTYNGETLVIRADGDLRT